MDDLFLTPSKTLLGPVFIGMLYLIFLAVLFYKAFTPLLSLLLWLLASLLGLYESIRLGFFTRQSLIIRYDQLGWKLNVDNGGCRGDLRLSFSNVLFTVLRWQPVDSTHIENIVLWRDSLSRDEMQLLRTYVCLTA